MNIAFDYLQGPALGHKTRCAILEKELVARGHRIVNQWDEKDWLVWDYPTWPHGDPPDCKRLLMGQLPQDANDYAWHPLGAAADRTMHGARYIMVDQPSVSWRDPMLPSILLTCGGSDPYRLTERLAKVLYGRPHVSIVMGPNFGRDIQMTWACYFAPNRDELRALMSTHHVTICTWGQTVFEALLIGASVLPIVTRSAHEDEANQLHIPYITRQHDFTDDTLLLRAVKGNFGMDYHGAQRVVEQMEAWL